MSRYIDADKLQETFKELHGGKRSLLIDTEPTADVIEVVRCKDCKHRHDSLLNGSPFEDFCDVFPAYIGKDDYCSYGERAEA